MVNLKSLFALLAVFSLIWCIISLGNFAVVIWQHSRAPTNVPLDNRQLVLAGILGGAFAVFFILHRLSKH